MENAVEIRGLCKRYRGFSLEDVSFDVPRGYIMGLIGPNGAGKTTIIKLLMGLIRRDAGEIRLWGEDDALPRLRSRIGFVYETSCFPEDCTVRQVGAAIEPFYPRWDGRRFAALVSAFGLPERKRLKGLSQGMQSKAALALALSHHAELLVMDEPAAGLDPVSRRELLETLAAEIQGGETTVLLSTHITADLEKIADFVTFLRGGRLVFSAPRHEIQERWAIVRGGEELLEPGRAELFRAIRRREHGVEALASDLGAIRSALGPGVVTEPATLEEIMVTMEEGSHAAQARP
jgi:ABC-2 type transport system ATP-binding protein